MARYSIVSYDNARSGQDGARGDRGEFDSAEAALERAKELVDRALEQLGATASADERMTLYTRWGSEVPMIYGEPRVPFRAYQYAREKANAMHSGALLPTAGPA
jgi:hypothetical protein